MVDVDKIALTDGAPGRHHLQISSTVHMAGRSAVESFLRALNLTTHGERLAAANDGKRNQQRRYETLK
jgi:hypothetical protein